MVIIFHILFKRFHTFFVNESKLNEMNDDENEGQKWTEIEAEPRDRLSVDEVGGLASDVEHGEGNQTKSVDKKISFFVKKSDLYNKLQSNLC